MLAGADEPPPPAVAYWPNVRTTAARARASSVPLPGLLGRRLVVEVVVEYSLGGGSLAHASRDARAPSFGDVGRECGLGGADVDGSAVRARCRAMRRAANSQLRAAARSPWSSSASRPISACEGIAAPPRAASLNRRVALRILESAVAQVYGGRKMPKMGAPETYAATSQSSSPLATAGMIKSSVGRRSVEDGGARAREEYKARRSRPLMPPPSTERAGERSPGRGGEDEEARPGERGECGECGERGERGEHGASAASGAERGGERELERASVRPAGDATRSRPRSGEMPRLLGRAGEAKGEVPPDGPCKVHGLSGERPGVSGRLERRPSPSAPPATLPPPPAL